MTDPTPQATQKPPEAIRLLPETRAKFMAVQQETRLTYSVIADLALDLLMTKQGISLPENEATSA